MKSKLVMVSMAAHEERRILPWIWVTLGVSVFLLVAQHWLWRDPPPAPAVPSPAAHSATEPASTPWQTLLDWVDTPRLSRPAAEVSDLAPADSPSDVAQLTEMAYTYPALLLELTGASPAIENGRFLGLRVATNADPALLAPLDLEPGDILIAVNGVSLESLDQSITLLDMFSGSGRLTFTVRRGDSVRVAG